tara:strand:+ start:2704 stop:2928 length:225 start_codon:yes stop_codon:yes gene_type:complete
MSKEVYYSRDELLSKSPEELVSLIESLIDEVESLRFMLDEFHNAQNLIGKNLEGEARRLIKEFFVQSNQPTEDN